MRWLATVIVAGLAVVAACSDPKPTSIDAATDLCGQCRSDQLCVAKYDGVCQSRGVTCVAKTVDCPNNACSSACETTYCGSPFQCQNRAPCGGEPAKAFTCYGP